MKTVLRFSLILLTLILVYLAPQPLPVAHASRATWIPTPSIWNPIADSQGTAWATEAYATCEALTVIVGSALDPFPQEFNGFFNRAYEQVSWHLVAVFNENRQPIALAPGQGTLIAQFDKAQHLEPLDKRIVREKAFTFAAPLLAGTRVFARVRVDYAYYDLDNPGGGLQTATFDALDVGDFNDNFDFVRADGLGYPDFGRYSFFCNAAERDNAPTVRLTGNAIVPEGSGAQTAKFYLALDKPTNRPIDVEFGVGVYNQFEQHGVANPNFSRPVCSGRPSSSTYVCPRGPEGLTLITRYTRIIIPAGQVSGVAQVNFPGNTEPNEYFSYSATISKVGGAHIDPAAHSGNFIRVDDDGCLGGLPPDFPPGIPCHATLFFPGGSTVVDKAFNFYITTNAVTGADGIPVLTEGAPATVTVHLNHQNYTASSITVNYRLDHGTTDDDDFGAPVTGALTFAPGEASKVVPLVLVEDGIVENREYARFILFGGQGHALTDSEADFTLWIQDANPGVSLLTNGGFEVAGELSRQPAGWRGQTSAKGRRVCNTANVTHARSGDCALRFGAGTLALNQRVIAPFTYDGGTLTLSAWFKSRNLTHGAFVTATVFYKGGGKAAITIRPRQGTRPAYQERSRAITLTGPVRRVVVQVNMGGSTGRLWVDDVQLTTRPAAAGLLPLPAPADAPADVTDMPARLIALPDAP